MKKLFTKVAHSLLSAIMLAQTHLPQAFAEASADLTASPSTVTSVKENASALDLVLPQEQQEAFIGSIHALTNNVPYMFFDFERFNELYGKAVDEFKQIDEGPQTQSSQQAKRTIEKSFVHTLVANGYTLWGKRAENKQLEKILQAYVEKNGLSGFDMQILNRAASYVGEDRKGSIVFVKDPHHPFNPTAFEEKRFDTLLNYPALDAKLFGAAAGVLHRVAMIAHELDHVGRKHDPSEKQVEREGAADVSAMEAILRLPNKKLAEKYVSTYMQYRIVKSCLDGDVTHATWPAIDRMMKERDPSYKSPIDMPEGLDYQQGIRELWYRFPVHYANAETDRDEQKKHLEFPGQFTPTEIVVMETRKELLFTAMGKNVPLSENASWLLGKAVGVMKNFSSQTNGRNPVSRMFYLFKPHR